VRRAGPGPRYEPVTFRIWNRGAKCLGTDVQRHCSCADRTLVWGPQLRSAGAFRHIGETGLVPGGTELRGAQENVTSELRCCIPRSGPPPRSDSQQLCPYTCLPECENCALNHIIGNINPLTILTTDFNKTRFNIMILRLFPLWKQKISARLCEQHVHSPPWLDNANVATLFRKSIIWWRRLFVYSRRFLDVGPLNCGAVHSLDALRLLRIWNRLKGVLTWSKGTSKRVTTFCKHFRYGTSTSLFTYLFLFLYHSYFLRFFVFSCSSIICVCVSLLFLCVWLPAYNNRWPNTAEWGRRLASWSTWGQGHTARSRWLPGGTEVTAALTSAGCLLVYSSLTHF
jgi:hypothetical protein